MSRLESLELPSSSSSIGSSSVPFDKPLTLLPTRLLARSPSLPKPSSSLSNLAIRLSLDPSLARRPEFEFDVFRLLFDELDLDALFERLETDKLRLVLPSLSTLELLLRLGLGVFSIKSSIPGDAERSVVSLARLDDEALNEEGGGPVTARLPRAFSDVKPKAPPGNLGPGLLDSLLLRLLERGVLTSRFDSSGLLSEVRLSR